MTRVLIIGDSHLKRINKELLEYEVSVCARGGLKVSELNEQLFNQDYDIFLLFVGGNDIHFHTFHNPEPKTVDATANTLISCQTFFLIMEFEFLN